MSSLRAMSNTEPALAHLGDANTGPARCALADGQGEMKLHIVLASRTVDWELCFSAVYGRPDHVVLCTSSVVPKGFCGEMFERDR